ncbi:Hyphally regulated cell wall protein N-terminal-domain-containing protein [Scheffersomyces xylosifermentans]|uniref:Hyphally regulated cell wall protein N-terminal-domain-containing protein n=1 Tax=Scheffersomyces xylosifermentans TaxID=1304137 RepID=UPI00315C5BCF
MVEFSLLIAIILLAKWVTSATTVITVDTTATGTPIEGDLLVMFVSYKVVDPGIVNLDNFQGAGPFIIESINDPLEFQVNQQLNNGAQFLLESFNGQPFSANFECLFNNDQSTMYFGTTTDTTFPFIGSQFNNFEGSIYFRQLERGSGGGISVTSPYFSNDYGAGISIVNQLFNLNTEIEGNGCFGLFEESAFYIQSAFPISSEQRINLASSEATLRVGAGLYNSDSPICTVTNFGLGNTIGLDTPLDCISYDTSTGILSLVSLGQTNAFSIGFGYDPDGFSIVSDDSKGLIPVQNNAQDLV